MGQGLWEHELQRVHEQPRSSPGVEVLLAIEWEGVGEGAHLGCDRHLRGIGPHCNVNG